MSTTVTAPAGGLRVGELAEAVGVKADTVRYYERAGLLPAPARTSSGYRTYDASAVDRMKFIQGAQRLGRRLADIQQLLTIATPAPARVSLPSTCCDAGSPNSTPRWPGSPPCGRKWSR